jgi:hypothetical protein
MSGRRLTQEEARDEFLAYIWNLIEYWNSTDYRVLPQPQSTRQRLQKLAFSILVAIDGESIEIPGCDLVPRVPKEDQEYMKTQGVNWFPDGEDISLGGLHDRFYGVGRATGKLKE